MLGVWLSGSCCSHSDVTNNTYLCVTNPLHQMSFSQMGNTGLMWKPNFLRKTRVANGIIGFRTLAAITISSRIDQHIRVLNMPGLYMTIVEWTISIMCDSDEVVYFIWTKDLSLRVLDLKLEANFLFLHRCNIYIPRTDERPRDSLQVQERKQT